MSGRPTKLRKVTVTKSVIERLRRQLLVTKLTPRQLLKEQKDAPEGLDADFIVRLLSGEMESVSVVIIEYFEALCEKEKAEAIERKTARRKASKTPKKKAFRDHKSKIQRKDIRNQYESIPDEKRQHLLSEIQRTGVSVDHIAYESDLDDIIPTQIRLVARGKQKKALMKHVDEIIRLYALKPGIDKSRKFPLPLGYRAVTEEDITILKSEIHRTCVSPARLCRLVTIKPTSNTIRGWIAGRVKSCLPDDMSQVLAAYASLKGGERPFLTLKVKEEQLDFISAGVMASLGFPKR